MYDVSLIVGTGLGLIGTYFVSSKSSKVRKYGFIVYFVSNLAWTMYWLLQGNYLPVVQYLLFSVMNVRGLVNN